MYETRECWIVALIVKMWTLATGDMYFVDFVIVIHDWSITWSDLQFDGDLGATSPTWLRGNTPHGDLGATRQWGQEAVPLVHTLS